MSVLPLPSSATNSWNMISPNHFTYKMDRPSYCTSTPVENTPANNECRMVEMRGAKVASFTLSGNQYICLPQAFELFLKHLVGGLHTVYTKLKRLSITPVVCNVEQVRILRGLGAIQPGVNRCKLILKKDFEVLYQDCTTASRPGRPPKRYPLLSHSSDSSTAPEPINTPLGQADVTSPVKKIRLSEKSEEDATSPNKLIDKDFPSPIPYNHADLQSNQNAQLAYIQQTLRHQYQQMAALSGFQTGMDIHPFQQTNPSLAQLFMMSQQAIIPPSINPSLAILNHFNQQIAQNQLTTSRLPNLQSTGCEAENEAKFDQEEKKWNSVKSLDRDHNAGDASEYSKQRNEGERINGKNNNGDCSSPPTFTSNHNTTATRRNTPTHSNKEDEMMFSNESCEAVRNHSNVSNNKTGSELIDQSSPVQNLLTQIQELLKLAVSSTSAQEKVAAREIVTLKEKLMQEKKLNEVTKRKLEDCQNLKVITEQRLDKEKEGKRRLESRLYSMQKLINQAVHTQEGVGGIPPSPAPPSPVLTDAESVSAHSESSSPRAPASSMTSSLDAGSTSSSAASSLPDSDKLISSPKATPSNFDGSLPSNLNNNSSIFLSSEEQLSPDFDKHRLRSEQHPVFVANPLMLHSTASH